MFFRGNNKKIFFLSLCLTITVGLFLFLSFVSAETTTLNFGLSYGKDTGLGGDDIRLIIARIIRAVLGLLGVLALGIMLWGGYTIMTSGGNEEKVQQGKKILMNGTIGLVIILSAFAIAQFVINQLAGATGAGVVNPKCKDPVYFDQHLEECDKKYCAANPKGCCLSEMKLLGLFVAQSITPRTDDAKMNNVAARAIFNMPISNQFAAGDVVDILRIIDKLQNKNEDITNKFDFVFLTDKDGNRMGVEARYKPDSGLCIDGKTGCLDNDNYRILVNGELTSESGKKISTGTPECPFPMEAEFGIKHDNKEEFVMDFDGKDDYINLGSNPLQNGSMTIEAWIYPTDSGNEGKPIVAVNSEQYALVQYNKNLKFRLAGVHPPGGEGYCDTVAYNAVEMSKWQHVVATYDATTMKQRIYVNGKTVGWEDLAKQQDACKTISGGGYKLKIGMQEVAMGEIINKYFPGKISDVCLYNTYFDASMVQSEYERGRGHCGETTQEGLKGVWHLNSGYGNQTVNLANPGKNDGQIIGNSKWSSEPIFTVTTSQYLSFNGTDANVELDAKSTADFKDKFSISLWVRVNGETSDDQGDYIIDKRQGGTPGSGYLLYYVKSNKSLGFDLRREDGALTIYQPIVIGKWYQVTWIYDGKESSVYIDGELKETKTAGTVKPIISYDGKLWIGGDQNGDVNSRFNGSIGELHLYDRVLNSEEIKVLASRKVGPYNDQMSETNGLVAGYRFDEGKETTIKDFSGSEHTAKIIGTGYSWTPVLPKGKVFDKTPPKVGNLLIKGQDKLEKVITGILNPITSAIIDNSGVGYGRIEIERTGANEEKTIEVDYFDGPAVVQGSDATPKKPYVYQYPWVPPKIEEGSAVYTITLNVWDIDHNQATVSTTVVAVPDHCTNGKQDEGETGIDTGGTCGGDDGSFCIVDSQCECGKCVKNKCISQPKILDVLPMDGAGGNWVTIMGKCFGKTAGKVEFSNGDVWKPADLVDCGDDKTWNDTWVIIKVPSDVDIPLNTSSSIKLTRTDPNGNPLSDTTSNEFGPKPGPQKDGLFLKTDVKRPGLCSVKAEIEGMWINQGYPGVNAVAKGSGFGKDGSIYFGGQSDPKTYLLTGGIQAKTSLWVDNQIDTKVPNNMEMGTVSVYVKTEGQPSNGVPFTVVSKKDITDQIPVIDSIDPATSTVKSYITIKGHGFGNEKGVVYLADNKEEAVKCAAQDLAECVKLNLDLPANCGSSTWTNTQVIAEVMATTTAKSYFLILKNSFNLHSSGEDKFGVISGPPRPSICRLEPSVGPAPLPNNEFLHLYGANFSDKISEDMVYFWWLKAVPNDISKWLKAMNEIQQPVSESEIITAIPIDKGTGSSIKTGPIKVGVKKDNKELLSNGVEYTVEDCRYAPDKLKGELDATGLRCCDTEGADLGLWKPKTIVCDGEKRDSGYVWRFTTGKIRQLPFVLEQCNEVDWNKPGVKIEFPSPVPSTLWKKGKEACVSAIVAARFNVSMDKESLKKPGMVRIFKCADAGLAADCKKYKAELKNWIIDPQFDNAVRILLPENQKTLEKNTWYHVELSDKIKSQDCAEIPKEAGSLSQCFSDPLQITKPCGPDTAYCFDFKTGTEMCTLKDASILPSDYTTNYLGLILDPSYPLNSPFIHPYYYLIWGRATQECVVMDVDGMGWNWTPPEGGGEKAFAKNAPSTADELKDTKVKFTDSRSKVTALEDTYGDPVYITASVDSLKTENAPKTIVDILKPVGTPLHVFTDAEIKIFDKLPDDDFVKLGQYKFKVSFSGLSELSTSTDQFEYAEGPALWYTKRYVFEKFGLVQIYILESQWANGKKERTFNFVDLTHQEAIVIDSQIFDGGDLENWASGEYEIERVGDKLTILNMKSGQKSDASLAVDNPIGEIGKTAIGGSIDGQNSLVGNIYKLELEKIETIAQSYKATSTLFIDVYPPTVIDYWPNCAEACISASVGAQFSRRMFTPSYKDNMILWQCADETCDAGGLTLMDNWFASDNIDSGVSNDQILRMSMNNKWQMLATSTWYLVKVVGGNDGVYGLGKTNVKSTDESAKGKPMTENFVWKFRTREDDSPCKADKVDIEPDPFMAVLIGEKTKYAALPKAFVGNCGGPEGQELNPWLYGWEWESGNDLVASVSNFKSSTSSNPFCTDACTLRGSDVASNQKSVYLCGNEKVEPGEDCDIAEEDALGNLEEEAGISCGFDCLRPGNTSTTTCGNANVENELGEECDPKKAGMEKTCSDKCLWKGGSSMLPAFNSSSTPEVPWCGSGTITSGEECDTKISPVGCSETCLHLGTKLAQSWCDDNPNVSACDQAISVCGNGGDPESGEECEQTEENKAYCSNYCLYHHICNVKALELSDFYCDKDKAEGCKEDCTWAGSSLTYSEPSICHDGEQGIGEYDVCEENSKTALLNGENPIQAVTAIGEEEPHPIFKTQTTTINATVASYYSWKIGDFVDLKDAKTTGKGKYTLKCGNTEYKVPIDEDNDGWKLYNDCKGTNEWFIGETDITRFGVADDSCCRERAFRNDEYPKNGAGISLFNEDGNIEPVCRNTYIAVKFTNRFIDQKTLPGNFVIAVGHKDKDYQCWKNPGETPVTDLVESALALKSGNLQENNNGFWQKIWQWFKGWLVRLTGSDAFADNLNPEDIKVWCGGGYTASPVLTYDWSKDYKNVTTTVALYLNKTLPATSTIAVILQGGRDGIKDTQGVGIRNPNPFAPELVDAWFFGTGEDVCKLSDVYVEPESWLFDRPNTTNTFKALVKSKSEQFLVPIKGQYDWAIDWQPKDNQIFEIPKEVLDPGVTTTVVIGARNVEGNVIAVANALVITDVYLEENQLGKTFTGMTNLTAKFCENPWPPREYFPFEDGIGFGKTVNVSGFTATGTFNGSALPSADGEYFNFSINYCADAGQSGTVADDLPYLRPAFFTSITTYQVPQPTQCQAVFKSGGSPGVFIADFDSQIKLLCQSDSDCPKFYNLPYANSLYPMYTEKCPKGADLETLIQNKCLLYTFLGQDLSPAGMGFCWKNNPITYPPIYGSPYKSCKSSADCNEVAGETCRLFNLDAWAVNNKCFNPGPKTVKEDTKFFTEHLLKRYVFLNDENDDAIGIQIFDNPDRVSAGKWVKDKFPSITGMNPSSVKDYEAVTDGKNYYINALNQWKYGVTTDLWNRIYLFSINKDAQQSTNNVFDQLMNSLEFNINISDIGSCLSDAVKSTKLPLDKEQGKFTGQTCVDDFDCRNAFGVPLSGTNGICSNAKTKLKRDLGRLNDYSKIQGQFKTYMDSHNQQAPDMKSGSYLSGYTVSKWPSWGKLGSVVGNLPADKVNKWAGCDEKADQLTCWDTVSSTFYCPNYMQAIEYEYVTSTKSYQLHGPLEYLDLGMSLTQSYINTDFLTTDPWCAPNQSHNQAAGLCGNGVINPGEECEPVGDSMISGWGVVSQEKEDGCADGYKNASVKNACAVDADCGFHVVDNTQTIYTDKTSACAFKMGANYELIRDIGWEQANPNKGKYAYGCSAKSDCQAGSFFGTYTERTFNGMDGFVGYVPTSPVKADLALWQWLTINNANIDCIQLNSLYPQEFIQSVDCKKAGTANYGKCSEKGQYLQATKVCNSSCKWDYTSCDPIYDCGNGIVEPGEECDDGGLNGTYGHCKAGCQSGYSEAYCGNGKIDGDTNNDGIKDKDENWIEFCDKNEPKYLKGYCRQEISLSCITDSSCKVADKCEPIPGGFEKKCHFGGQSCLQDMDCSYQLDKGPCDSFNDPLYDFYQKNTCSWDCQGYGEYCGDGKVKPNYEECDDKDKNELNSCDSFCEEVNVACREATSFTTSTFSTMVTIFKDKKAVTECVDTHKNNSNLDDTGNEICKAYNLSCEKIQYELSNTPGVWVDYVAAKCYGDLSWLSPGSEVFSGFRVICKGVYAGASPEEEVTEVPKEESKKFCGNGIVDEIYKDEAGKDVKEVCDMGAQNGLTCVPPYGKSCSYCSSDCKEVLSVNAKAFCGNNKGDAVDEQGNVAEKCENINGVVNIFKKWGIKEIPKGEPPFEYMVKVSYPEYVPKVCPDKGKVLCPDCLKEPVENCVACGFDKNVGKDVDATLRLINVLYPNTSTIMWPDSGQSQLTLYYGDGAINIGPLTQYTALVVDKNKVSNFKFVHKLNSAPICNIPGKHYYYELSKNSTFQDIDWKAKRMVDVLVAGEKQEDGGVIWSGILSPPALRTTGGGPLKSGDDYIFRVVIRWTKEEGMHNLFGFVIQNDAFDGWINSTDVWSTTAANAYPSSQQMIKIKSERTGTYLHPHGGSAQASLLSVTIDTAPSTIQPSVNNEGKKYRFAVKVADGSPIAPYRMSNLKVEVYNTHQDPLSIYKLDHEFYISSATGSSNDSALFWHVFDFEKVEGSNKYKLVPVELIQSTECEVLGKSAFECES